MPQTIELFFTGNQFEIPSYQRDYAWQIEQINDLFEDIQESLETNTSHYLGTFILSNAGPAHRARVVDGQQRLTTLTMVLKALVDAVQDQGLRQHYSNVFIRHPINGLKLTLLGDNQAFFEALLGGTAGLNHQTGGQKRLQEAYRWIRDRTAALGNAADGQATIQKWLQCIGGLEVLHFTTNDEGRAIRMFQSLNDRGVPLAKMDLVKSLLIYYSNRFLNGKLDTHISTQFGHAFRSFSRIKELASEQGYKITHIDRAAFRDDDILRYHYLAFDGYILNGQDNFTVDVGADYEVTADGVMKNLKRMLNGMRGDANKLEAFIQFYTDDLTSFFEALRNLIDNAHNDLPTYLLWVIQDLNATLYPLVMRLYMKGWLEQVPTNDTRNFLELVAVTDLRVYKLKATNPQKDVIAITRDLRTSSQQSIAERLLNFCRRFMGDEEMASTLVNGKMYQNPGLPRILLEEEFRIRKDNGDRELDLPTLVGWVRARMTIEHILPQNYEMFGVKAYGFQIENYDLMNDRLGNLIYLESVINIACSNHSPQQKIDPQNGQQGYPKSDLQSVRSFAANCQQNSGGTFKQVDLVQRSQRLASATVARWYIPQSPT